MASIVEQSVEIDRPVGEVFAYVEDYTQTPTWMYGLNKMEAVTEQVTGVGATFDGIMKLGVSLASRIRCTEFAQDELIELTSIQGIKNTQRWSFTDLGDGRTRVDAHITYELPGGPAGKVMAAAVKPVIGIAVKQSSHKLVENLSAAPAAGS